MSRRSIVSVRAATLAALVPLALSACATHRPESYSTPEQAVHALLDAADDPARVRELAAQRIVIVEGDEPGRMIALLGADEWPLPLPLERADGRWRFDVAAAREDLRCRSIGANELLVLDALRTIADEQARHAAAQPGPEPPAFEPVAGPLHGYHLRALAAQGEHACGGARNYVDAQGRQTGGFALVAWPERYGETGVMTFLIDRTGIPYEKDLGEATEQAAEEIAAFDPDPSWSPVEE
jgi:hypothetical protein